MAGSKALVMILAGGEGRRLLPLTRDRAKPAVPFGGRYRIIDFVLNNFINSGFYKIKVLTQYKSDSLNLHISRGWPMSPILGQYIDLVPAQMRIDGHWYKGTADAVFQNLTHIYDEPTDQVCVFGGDHIYIMDVEQMYDYHLEKGADLTISAIPVPKEQAKEFGVIEVDETGKLISFEEKPQNPKTMPNNPEMCLVSMGNYIFERQILIDEVTKDSSDENSKHDFGKNIIPNMLRDGKKIYIYDFMTNKCLENNYWKDVGSVDSYWQANMDLLEYTPELNLYSAKWPLRTFNYNYPPAKFIWEEGERIGMATNSLVSEGCIISGGSISKCVLSPKVRINSFSNVVQSILMENVNVGRYCDIRKAIIDQNVDIPPYTQIGINREDDLARGFVVSEGGVVVVPKGAKL